MKIRKFLAFRENSKKEEIHEANDSITSIYLKIEKEMMLNKTFLDPDLSLESLSRVIGTNRTYVSKAIMERGSGFRSYINNLRTEHLISLINEDPEIYNYPKDGEMLALDSGFSNRRSMDRALKTEKGTTLYQIRKKQYNNLKK